MKNLKKINRKELKEIKGGDGGPGEVDLGGGNPTRAYCYQHMTQFVEALPEDYCNFPENATSLACQCKRLYGF